MRTHFFMAMTLGLLAAACQLSDQGLSTAPQSPPPAYAANYPSAYSAGGASSGQVCADYGFSPGTAAFDRCVQRERAARAAEPNSRGYNQCVGREIDARRYQGSSQATPAHRTDQYGNRIDSQGYRIDAYGNRLPRQG